MVIAARVTFEWKSKLTEQATMAKLISYVHNRPISDFQEKTGNYLYYITDNKCRFVKQQKNKTVKQW